MAAVTKLPAIFPSEEFLTEGTDLRGGERVVTRYACSICSGSFPTVRDMERGSGHILHVIQSGMESEFLRSRGVWLCTASPTGRC